MIRVFSFLLLSSCFLIQVNAQNMSSRAEITDTLGERLVTHHMVLFDKTFSYEVGAYNFTVQRKKILDSLFYKTPDNQLHFFMIDTAEEEVYKGSPELQKVVIPVDSFFVDAIRDPDNGQILAFDTIRSVVLQSRFVFEIPSVNDFFNTMKWLERFEEKYPQYRLGVFMGSGSGPFLHLGNYNIRNAVAHMVSYMFKRQTDDWFVLKLYVPDVHFEEPTLEMLLHYHHQ